MHGWLENQIITHILQKASLYVKGYGGKTKWMYFSIEDNELLKRCDIWEQVSNSIKSGFDSKLINNKNILETRTKSNRGWCLWWRNTMSRLYSCLAVLLAVFRKDVTIIHKCF